MMYYLVFFITLGCAQQGMSRKRCLSPAFFLIPERSKQIEHDNIFNKQINDKTCEFHAAC